MLKIMPEMPDDDHTCDKIAVVTCYLCLLVSSHLLFFKNSCQTQLCTKFIHNTYTYNKMHAVVTNCYITLTITTYKFGL